MNQEYKDFLKQLFHDPEHEMREPDYYSRIYIISRETEKTIDLLLDDDFLDRNNMQSMHGLVTNLMEEGLMITRLVIASKPDDQEWLDMQITEIPMEEEK